MPLNPRSLYWPSEKIKIVKISQNYIADPLWFSHKSSTDSSVIFVDNNDDENIQQNEYEDEIMVLSLDEKDDKISRIFRQNNDDDYKTFVIFVD